MQISSAISSQPLLYPAPVQVQADRLATRSGQVAADRPVPALDAETGVTRAPWVPTMTALGARGGAETAQHSDTTTGPAGTEEETEPGEQTPSGEKTADAQDREAAQKTPLEELTSEEQREVQQLRQRDLEVRAHEQAHVAAGGQYVTKAPSYDYETGPDGQRYAIGGEVSIDVAPIPGDPHATIAKAQVVLRAALAPAEPSPQDQQVASAARSMEAQARGELLKDQPSEASKDLDKNPQQTDQSLPPSDEAQLDKSAETSASARLQQRFERFFPISSRIGLSQYA